MIRVLLVTIALVVAGCAKDTPTVGRPQEQPTSSPEDQAETPAESESEDIAVAAVEYEFQGVPDAVSAGPHRFILSNEGEERHVLYLFLITGDESIDELIELPEKKANKVTQAVDRAEAEPGETDQFNADLIPGRFGYVCFVETKDGTPHFALGMRGEFAVV